MNNILSGLGLGGLLGPSTTGIQNAAQQNTGQQGVWVTTTSNTAGQVVQPAVGAQNPSMYGLMQETHKMLEEVREDLFPLKKWLIATYPDIYKQYVAVEEIRKASND